MHGTISPQRKQQIDAEFWGAYLIVIAAAANRYIGSSKTRTNPAATVVRGAPALVAAAAPAHRLKVNIISVK